MLPHVCKLAVHAVDRWVMGAGDVLRKEELELLIGKLAQLRTEHIVDSDVICIPAVGIRMCVSQRGSL